MTWAPCPAAAGHGAHVAPGQVEARASAAGSRRWAFLGTTTTMKAVSTGDAVTVK
ncbi:hypothetical protein ACIQM3_03440 [Streptomyces sp. NPDC091271]|uniref:hypothetical protein n=1 Tax=Streptomyces sp. NPDC091271 TaxID=3365980 RepID=UPI0037F4CAEB